MNAAAAFANTSWLAASIPEWLRFRRAACNVEAVQRRLLNLYLSRNATTEFGRAHDFSALTSWEDYAERVPIRTYDDFHPWIERIAQGEHNVLTSEKVAMLEPSSGSTGPEKWVPYTRTLQAEYRRAVAAWMAQNFIDSPGLLGGRAYWSLTPQPPKQERAQTRVPVGFDDDSAYLGGLAQRLVSLTLVTQPELRKIHDMERFRHVTLLLLLRCQDLRLVSVWHPSYLLLLLAHLRRHWSSLLEDLHAGIDLAEPQLQISADPARARDLDQLGPDDAGAIWPSLRLISCWGDAHAAGPLEDVRSSFPGVSVQPKGLVATEAFATLPFGACRPLAIRSHFFEFMDEHGIVHPGWSLQQGESYSIVVTTGGGLYRYRLQDRVKVTGYLHDVPSLCFTGKEDNISDYFGEKLDETFVAQCLEIVFDKFDLAPRFSMLAMDMPGNPPGYSLYLQCESAAPEELTKQLELELCRNPHYELCVRLGQLRPVRTIEVAERAYEIYSQSLVQRGMRLGDIKPTPLSRLCDWSKTFP
ncbi:MAG: GH3 auxin-responsive promoter family protein [Gammaproteobacteria bacterium]|nr:GH3 auxin-responsive promoter family protein [Gammaproteobacteria bacterium]MBT8110000.1 GH3 auxin-responsive promoter family protein [Gammaproteobacteria bacterium]NND48479.1 GH3 auxin-responsive promoter [Woeseiaceae bacterium]NNL44703.1 GH3 auxin-responsive promoter [Woeseiaceae bacterium]